MHSTGPAPGQAQPHRPRWAPVQLAPGPDRAPDGLCVFAVDLRGGLGIGDSYEGVHVDSILRHDQVRVIGAVDLLEICQRRDTTQRTAASQQALTPRGADGIPDFGSRWRQRIAFAIRKALVAHVPRGWR